MADYIVHYTLNSRNHMDIPQSKEDYIRLMLENGEEINQVVEEKLEKIVQDPNSNNTSIQVHNAFKITEEIKLKKYNFKKIK